METFYCNVCDKDVVLKDGVCPFCQTNWKKIQYESAQVDNQPKEESDKLIISDEKIEDNIEFFLHFAYAIIALGIIIGVLIIWLTANIVSLSIKSNKHIDNFSLIIMLIAVILLLVDAIFTAILVHSLKWKAYMLYTNKNKSN